MIDRILIALDGSSESEDILGEVERVAGPHTEIELLHVLEAKAREIPGKRLLGSEVARTYLDQIAGRLQQRRTGIHLRTGHPGEEIPAAARKLGVDLIALTTHARRGLSRLFMGSVAETVVRNSSIPVLLTRPELSRPRKPLERILVPIDGSNDSKQVFNSVRHLAKDSGVEVILVEVVPAQTRILPDPLSGIPPILAADLTPDPTSSLRAYAYKLEREGLKTRSLVVYGSAADQILEQAKLLDVDLIAMASGTRSGLSRVFQRSISFDVLRHTDRAVLLHRIMPEAESGVQSHALHVQEETY